MKLKGKDCIKLERERLLKLQKGIDPITGLKIKNPVLDHDHLTGRVRAVLENPVNRFEGIIVKGYARHIKHLGISLEDFLINLQGYWQQDYSQNAIHPRHKTETDKLIRQYRKRLKTVKREATKQKYKNLIKDLQKTEL